MQLSDMVPQTDVPVHVGIIMDGNGRWATKRNLPRSMGHKEGLETAKKIIHEARVAGISHITLYTFSTENWKRTSDEVGYLMNLIKLHLRAELDFYTRNGIRLGFLGDMQGLSADVRDEITGAIRDCSRFTGITVNLAINYGGRDEIVRAAKKLAAATATAPASTDPARVSALTEKDFAACLDLPDLPDVDLLIRTGGEKRLSNFLLWQCAYAELFFTDTLWPEYTPDEFRAALAEFQKRSRRFGGA